jgi:hypothetical protein
MTDHRGAPSMRKAAFLRETRRTTRRDWIGQPEIPGTDGTERRGQWLQLITPAGEHQYR